MGRPSPTDAPLEPTPLRRQSAEGTLSLSPSGGTRPQALPPMGHPPLRCPARGLPPTGRLLEALGGPPLGLPATLGGRLPSVASPVMGVGPSWGAGLEGAPGWGLGLWPSASFGALALGSLFGLSPLGFRLLWGSRGFGPPSWAGLPFGPFGSWGRCCGAFLGSPGLPKGCWGARMQRLAWAPCWGFPCPWAAPLVVMGLHRVEYLRGETRGWPTG